MYMENDGLCIFLRVWFGRIQQTNSECISRSHLEHLRLYENRARISAAAIRIMSKKQLAVTFLVFVGIATGAMRAQPPARGGRGAEAGPPSVSKRAGRQIGSSALDLIGLRVGFSAVSLGQISFSEAAAKADALGTGFLEAADSQKVSFEISKSLDYNLSPDELMVAKNRLAELRLRLVAYRMAAIPTDENFRRKLFAFAKALDVETI